MASVKLKLRTNKPNSRGECPIIIRIIHNRRSTEVATGKYLDPSYWDPVKERVYRRYTNAKLLNAFLNQERMAFQTIIDEMDAKQTSYTIQDILDQKNGDIFIEGGEQLFTRFLENFIQQNPEKLKYNTLCNYKSTLFRFRQFNAKLRVMDINEDILIQFEKFLIQQCGNRTNTVHSRMKIIRKMVKVALRRQYISVDPFRNYRLKTERTVRAYLTIEELKRIEAYESPVRSHQIARDVFLFACYSGLSRICAR